MGRDASCVGTVAAMIAVAAVVLAAPEVGRAQTPLLTAGRSAVMIQVGLDGTSIEHKSGGQSLLKLDGTTNGQPWGSITGMFATGSRASLLLGVSAASIGGDVENTGHFTTEGGGYYSGWKQSGYTVRIQAGAIIWLD